MNALRSLRVTPLYIDRSVIVVNKPAGLISQAVKNSENPSENGDSGDYLESLRGQLDLEEGLWPVHRLDKGTTGTLLLARSATHVRNLQSQFKTREVEKTYLALVRGGQKSFPGRSGELRDVFRYGDDGRFERILPVGSEKKKKKDGGGVIQKDKSKEGLAETHWELLGSSPKAPLSLVKLSLISGMKHQLRIHLAKILQTPILGDTLYSRSEISPSIAQVTHVPDDLYLHASHISFFKYKESGPHKRFRLGVTAPLPRNFRQLCQKFDIRVPQEMVDGGLFVDGVKVNDEVAPPGGRWLLNNDGATHGREERITTP